MESCGQEQASGCGCSSRPDSAPAASPSKVTESTASKPRRFVGVKRHGGANVSRKSGELITRRGGASGQVPEWEVEKNPKLVAAVDSLLPKNYNFEIFKTVWRLNKAGSKVVALQFPEGLLMYSCIISDILEEFAGVSTIIMGDVTYGACCVDDLTAQALGADFLVHYGHSCLVPMDNVGLQALYVFVDIGIDTRHFVDCVKLNFEPGTNIAMVGTVQFNTALQAARQELAADYPSVALPQEKPLSQGEVLGCTAPRLSGPDGAPMDAIIYLGDGRFHLESAMIANPTVEAYRYEPYSKVFTRERYDIDEMVRIRGEAIAKAAGAKRIGVILGTLGRQGNTYVLDHLQSIIRDSGRNYFTVLLSEIFPAKLALWEDVDAWVQVACPRLSIDWGYAFEKPLLSPYELETMIKGNKLDASAYPMDYYSKNGGKYSAGHYNFNRPRKPRAHVKIEAEAPTTSVSQ